MIVGWRLDILLCTFIKSNVLVGSSTSKKITYHTGSFFHWTFADKLLHLLSFSLVNYLECHPYAGYPFETNHLDYKKLEVL
jgi:hypothetical protein